MMDARVKPAHDDVWQPACCISQVVVCVIGSGALQGADP
jgi:hypothetical protein